jgi:hypothetical protein
LKWSKNQIGFVIPTTNNNRRNSPPRIKECLCRHCNVPFNRAHVNTCPLVTHHQGITNKHWNLFKKNAEKTKQLFPHANNYTIVDHLINCFQIKTFQEIFKIITDNLEYVYHGSPEGPSSHPTSSSHLLSMEEVQSPISNNSLYTLPSAAETRSHLASPEPINGHHMTTRCKSRRASQMEP